MKTRKKERKKKRYESAFLTNTGETCLQEKNGPGWRRRRRYVEDTYGIIEVPI
jgi:hypothetical protein